MSEKSHDLRAVLTGDIVGYSRAEKAERERILHSLKASLEDAKALLPSRARFRFQMYRGDSFQGVVVGPEFALRAAVLVRAGLRSRANLVRRREAPDCRIAIGVGTIDSLPSKAVSEGDGDAFRRSGPVLDAIKRDRRLVVSSPWPEVDAELTTQLAMFDAVARRWSPQQAEVVIAHLKGLTQAEIARSMGISQPAVMSRLKAAGASAVRGLCERYEGLVLSKISP
jgi:hypothetical protein